MQQIIPAQYIHIPVLIGSDETAVHLMNQPRSNPGLFYCPNLKQGPQTVWIEEQEMVPIPAINPEGRSARKNQRSLTNVQSTEKPN